MNTNIFVHLGLAKTASTFLQQGIFSKHSEINYLGKNLVDEKLHKAGQRIVRNQIGKYNELEIKQVFLEAITKEKEKKVHLYSEEDLSVFKFLDPSLCACRLKHIFTDYNAFLFIREPLSWINSQYYFRLSTYRVDTLKGFRPWLRKHFKNLGVGSDIAEIKYADLIQKYEPKIGQGLLQVYLYEQFKDNPQLLLEDIGDFMGINKDELLSLNKATLQKGKHKERMTVKRENFIKNAYFLTTNNFDLFQKNLEEYLTLIPRDKEKNLSSVFQDIENLFTEKNTDLEVWKPTLHKIEKALNEYFSSSPKAENEIPENLKNKIKEISIQQNQMLLKKFNLPLEKYGYLLGDQTNIGGYKLYPEPTKNNLDPITNKISEESRNLINQLKNTGLVNYLKLAASLTKDGLISKNEAIDLERRKKLPEWLFLEIKNQQKKLLCQEIKEGQNFRKIDINLGVKKKTKSPQCLYDGPIPETLTPPFVKCPATNIMIIEKGKFWLENFQKIVLWEDQSYYNWDSSANVSWLVPIISSLKPQYFYGKMAVMSSPGAALFSHWLFDLLPKFDLLFSSGYTVDDIDYFLINPQNNSYHLECLQRLGIPENKIVYQTGKLNFISADTLIIPSPIRQGFYTPQWALDFVKNLLSNNHQKINNTEKTKFYISRNKAKRRRIINEEEIKVVLDKFNYQTIYAEDYNLTDFVVLISQASAVVSPHGAGLANLVFAPSSIPVLEIFGPHISAEYWLLAHSREQQYHLLAGYDRNGLFPWENNAFPYQNFQEKNGYDFFVSPQQLESALVTLEQSIVK